MNRVWSETKGLTECACDIEGDGREKGRGTWKEFEDWIDWRMQPNGGKKDNGVMKCVDQGEMCVYNRIYGNLYSSTFMQLLIANFHF